MLFIARRQYSICGPPSAWSYACNYDLVFRAAMVLAGEVSGAPKVSLYLRFYLPCFSRQEFRRATLAT